MTDFTPLAISGRIATPDDAEWDQARAAWNLAADQQPEAVAFPESAAEVAEIVRFAGQNDLRVAGQSTGHGAVALEPLEGTILIKTERMRGIEIDPAAGTARAEAGVLGLEVGEAAQPHGLTSMPGSSPDVGIAGFTLGGGMSWLGRKHGFACNRLRAIELVTADGEQRTVDAEQEPDLFWALRGGGGGYAIVTALHLKLLAIPQVYGGALVFPAELGAEAIRAYRDWAATMPEEVTTVVRFVTPPPIPDVPEPIRGVPLLTIDGASIGTREEGEERFAPLRQLGETIMDSMGWMPSSGLYRIHMDPESPVPALGHHSVISELPDEAIDAFVSKSGPESGSPLLLAELRQIGGAFAREPENAGALAKLDGEFAMFAIGMPMAAGMAEAIEGHLDELKEAIEPWRVGGGYFNFAERPCDVDAILPADVCARLAEVKRHWDPNNMIVANHALSLAAA